MKNMIATNNKKRDSKVFGLELLNENEMLNLRGGEQIPKSRVKDQYDDEDE